MRPKSEFSNQFPIKPSERRTVGVLWYNDMPVNGAILIPFWGLNEIKKDMICHGYKRELFKITY